MYYKLYLLFDKFENVIHLPESDNFLWDICGFFLIDNYWNSFPVETGSVEGSQVLIHKLYLWNYENVILNMHIKLQPTCKEFIKISGMYLC